MENQNEDIIKKFETEEKKSRKRMFAYSSIPLIITIFLVVVSYITVNNANKEITDLRTQKIQLDSTIIELDNVIKLKSDSLAHISELAVNYRNKRYEFNYAIDKELYSLYPKQTEMLSEMRGMIQAGKVKWKLRGYSPDIGFDSPSFATFMINRHSNTEIPGNERYKIMTILPPTENPEVGDIVFYEHGYAMFYFEYGNKPFVVGMTPLGLTSLQFDFDVPRLGFGKVEY